MALSIAACDAIEDDTTVEVGVLLSLTGTLEDYGEEVLRGIELAREEVNKSSLLGDVSLTFVIRDD